MSGLTQQKYVQLVGGIFEKQAKQRALLIELSIHAEGFMFLNLTDYDVTQLKKHYKKAVKAGAESFKIKFVNHAEPAELVTGYAKYLLEYLESLREPEQKRVKREGKF